MKKVLFTCMFFCFATITAFSQKKILDSLISVEKNYSTEDTIRVKILAQISGILIKADPKRSIEYADNTILIAQKINFIKGIAIGKTNKALALEETSRYDEAILLFYEAIDLFKKIDSKPNLGNVYISLGAAYYFIGNLQKAIDITQNAYDIMQSLGNKPRMAYILNNIGFIYKDLGDYTKAITYYQNALKIDEETGNTSGIVNDLSKIGGVYRDIPDYPKALETFQKIFSLDLSNVKKEYMGYAMQGIGSVYNNLQDRHKAIEYYQKGLKIFDSIIDKTAISQMLNDISQTYIYLSDYPNALEYARKMKTVLDETKDARGNAYVLDLLGIIYRDISDTDAIKIGIDPLKKRKEAIAYLMQSLKIRRELGVLYMQRELLSDISKTYEIYNRYDSAYAYYKQYITIRDSIINDKKKNEIKRLGMQYEYDKKEAELKTQQLIKDEKIKQQELLNKQQQQSLLLSNNMLVLNQKELLVTNQEKDIQHLNYLKTQADLEAEQTRRKEKEKDNKIVEQKLQLQESQTKNTIYLSAFAIIIIVASFIFIIYQSRIRQLKKMIQVRNTIAANLHDEVGSTLSSISIMSQAAKKKGGEGGAGELLENISANSQNMLDSMSDIVWSINPKNDKLQDILVRMRQFAAETLETQNVDVTFDVQPGIEKQALPMEYRKDIYLVYKEAVNNIAKYAKATQAVIRLYTEDGILCMQIKDNGKGFTKNGMDGMGGNGIKNMRQRAEQMKGTIDISSKDGVSVLLKLPAKALK